LKGVAVIGTVKEIHRYPVKSMGGESLDECIITWHGVVGDRVYTVHREHDGVVITAKMKEGYPLLQCTARYTERGTLINLPDGSALVASVPEVEKAVGDLLGLDVYIQEILAQGERDRPTNYKPPFSLRPGVGFDSSPLHIVTTASIAMLAEHAPHDEVVKRVRPNLVIDTGDATGFIEHDWAGELKVGLEPKERDEGDLDNRDPVEIFVRKDTERCGLTTAPQQGLEAKPEILRHITQNNGKNFGIYAVTVKPSVIRVGDPVRLK
jgi:uncharacterized protein